MGRNLIFILTCISALWMGCNYGEPTVVEIAGTWTGGDSVLLEFSTNGTMKGENLPTEYFDYVWNRDYGTKFNITGRWKFDKLNEPGKIILLLSIIEFDTVKFDVTGGSLSDFFRINYIGSTFWADKPPWRLYVWDNKADQTGKQFFFYKVQ